MVNEEKEVLNNDALASFTKNPIQTCLNMFDNLFNKHKKEEVMENKETVALDTTLEVTEEVKADEAATESTEEVKADEVVAESTEEVKADEAATESTEEVKADEAIAESAEEKEDLTPVVEAPVELDGNVDLMVGVNDSAVDVS